MQSGGNTVATIVVGIEDSFRAEDAVALAGDLAAAADAEVLAVSAYRFDDDAAGGPVPGLRRTTDRLHGRTRIRCAPAARSFLTCPLM
jgi:hypothetical protein